MEHIKGIIELLDDKEIRSRTNGLEELWEEGERGREAVRYLLERHQKVKIYVPSLYRYKEAVIRYITKNQERLTKKDMKNIAGSLGVSYESISKLMRKEEIEIPQ